MDFALLNKNCIIIIKRLYVAFPDIDECVTGGYSCITDAVCWYVNDSYNSECTTIQKYKKKSVILDSC